MAYESLKQHLRTLGAAENTEPIVDFAWADLAPSGGAHVPDVLRWLVEQYAGTSFARGATFRRPDTGTDVLLGWLLDADELAETRADTRGVVPEGVLPIENDGSDNHVAVGVGSTNSGQVYWHQHDAPQGAHVQLVEDSLEHFLMALQPLDLDDA